jgi:SAM-dependent methyltransferase
MINHQLHPEDWHQRFYQQASWTASIRRRLYKMTDITNASHVLEVGSGTGVITEELATLFGLRPIGLDIDHAATAYANSRDRLSSYVTGDGLNLPFPNHRFDTTICHFLLMWIPDPDQVVLEMVRVTKPNGWVMALAEPDYGGRIDYPLEFAECGAMQERSLDAQGADPRIGRKLRALLTNAGLVGVKAGVLGGEWHGSPSLEEHASEWRILASDLGDTLSKKALTSLEQLDRKAWENGSRILFVPTFYAHGRVAAAPA